MYGLNIQNRTIQQVLQHHLSNERKSGHKKKKTLHPQVIGAQDQFEVFRQGILHVIFRDSSSGVRLLRQTILQNLWDMTDHKTNRLVVTDLSVSIEGLKTLEYQFEALTNSLGVDLIECLSLPENTRPKNNPQTLKNMVEEVVKRVGGNESGGAELAKQQELAAGGHTYNNQLVVNVAEEVKRGIKKMLFPAAVAKEAVLLQYVGDTNLDSSLQEILMEVFSRGTLPPNPFPMVLSRIKAQAMRQSLWTEEDPELLFKFKVDENHSKLVDQNSFTYYLKESKEPMLFGSMTALQFCDPTTLSTLLGDIFADIHNSSTVDDAAAATSTTKVCTGLTGNSVLMSNILKHKSINAQVALRLLKSISILETYVVEGPRYEAALKIFQNMVINHVTSLDLDSPHIVLGIFTGEFAVRAMNKDMAGHNGGWARNKDTLEGDSDEYLFAPKYKGGKEMKMDYIKQKNNILSCKKELKRCVEGNMPIVIKIAYNFDDNAKDSFKSGYIMGHKVCSFHYIESGTQVSRVSDSYQLPKFCAFDFLFRTVYESMDSAARAAGVINAPANGGYLENIKDPEDQRSLAFQQHSKVLKLRAARNMAHGNILDAYRSLLWLVTLEDSHQDKTFLHTTFPDLLRMLKHDNLALLLELAAQEAENLECILSHRLESRNVRRKTSKTTIFAQFQKLEKEIQYIMGRPDCIFLKGIRASIFYLLTKIDKELQDQTKNEEIEQSVHHLGELKVYLRVVQNAAAHCIHMNSPGLEEIFRKYARRWLSSDLHWWLHE